MKTLLAAGVLTVAGSVAAAQDFYVGGALDYAYPHSGDTQTAGSLIAGVDVGYGQYGYGGEVEFGTHLAGGGDFDTRRSRAFGAYDLGAISVRAAGGLTAYERPNETESGYNLGIGVQNDMGRHLSLRAEFIRDFMDEGATAAVTTTRIAAFYRF